MGENEKSDMVKDGINSANDVIMRHAKAAIELVRGISTVSELRNLMDEVMSENTSSLIEATHHSCGLENRIVAMHVLNIRLLYYPLAVNPATGSSLADWKERVVRDIERARDRLVSPATDADVRRMVDKLTAAFEKFEARMGMEELKHGATRH